MQTSYIEPVVVKIGKGSHHFTIDPKTNKVYLANNKSNSIQVIDSDSDKIIDTILIERPRNLVYNSNEDKLYAISGFMDWGTKASTGSNISIFDTSTNKLIKEIGEREAFSGIGLHPTSNRIYAASRSSKNLISIDSHTDEIVDKIELDRNPSNMGINPRSNKIYIKDYDRFTISVIDITKKIISKKIDSNNSGDIKDILVDPANDRVYVKKNYTWGNEGGGGSREWIEIIDGKNDVITSSIEGDINNVIHVSNPTERGVFFYKIRKKQVIISNEYRDLAYISKNFWPTSIFVNPETYKLYLTSDGFFNHLLRAFKNIPT